MEFDGATHFHLNQNLTGQIRIQIIGFECPSCGAQMLREKQRYCHECGAKNAHVFGENRMRKNKSEKIPSSYKKDYCASDIF